MANNAWRAAGTVQAFLQCLDGGITARFDSVFSRKDLLAIPVLTADFTPSGHSVHASGQAVGVWRRSCCVVCLRCPAQSIALLRLADAAQPAVPHGRFHLSAPRRDRNWQFVAESLSWSLPEL